MADILLDALKPYMSAGAFKDLPYSTYGEFDRTQFSPEYSLGLMREYNRSYGLGLTDAQMAAGIKAFGDNHQSQFGVGISALSNPVAVAAESVARALSSAGKDAGSFWAKASPYLSQGEDMAQRNWNNTSTATQTEQRAATSQGEDWFGDLVMSAAPLLMAGAVGGAFSPGGLFGGAGATAGAAGLDAAALATGDAMAGLIPAGELGAWTGASAGAGTLGGNAMDFADWFSNIQSGNDFNITDYLNNGGVEYFGDSGGWNPLTDGYGMGDAVQANGWDFGPLSDSLMNGGADPISGMTLDQMKPGLLDTIKSYITSNPGSTLKTAISALTSGTGGGSLLGAGLGGLLGLLNGSKQAGTTTTTTEPWAGQQPFLLDAFRKAQAASGGSPLQTQANANYQSVLSGPTTNPMLGMDNPYLTKAIDNANSDVTRAMMPAMNQANRASGSFGNSGVADTYGKSLTDAYSRNATGMRMQDYTNQQQLQQQAVQNNLGLTTGANTFVAQPSQNYAQTVQGNYGQTQTSPYFTNPFAGFAGGAAIGSKIGANLGF